MFLFCSSFERKPAGAIRLRKANQSRRRSSGRRKDSHAAATLAVSPLTNLPPRFTAGFEDQPRQADVITTFSGQIVRMDCRRMLPFGDIHIGRNRLLVAQWWG
jgi:hypothetical protein